MNWTVGIGMIGVMALGGLSPALIDRAVENGLKKNFGPFKTLSVSSQTDFLSLLNGKVEKLTIRAEGFDLKGLPVRQMEIGTGRMHFDTWGALKGQARWLNEIEATASGVLDESSLNSLIARPEVQSQLKNIRLNLPMAETANIENLQIVLDDKRIDVKGILDMGTGFPLPFRLSGTPEVQDHQLFVRQVGLKVMGVTLSPSLYEEAFRKPVDLPALTNLRYRLDGILPQKGSLGFSGAVWLPAAK